MDGQQQITPEQFLVFLFALGCGCLLAAGYWYWMFESGPVAWMVGFVRFVQRTMRAQSVNTSPLPAPEIMSNSADDDHRLSPSSLQTDSADSPDRQTAPTREQQLTLYRFLRELGASREKARPVLKAAGWPLDNNLWTEAAPAPPPPAGDDDMMTTPFAGRVTRKSYYPDQPELEYQPPQS